MKLVLLYLLLSASAVAASSKTTVFLEEQSLNAKMHAKSESELLALEDAEVEAKEFHNRCEVELQKKQFPIDCYRFLLPEFKITHKHRNVPGWLEDFCAESASKVPVDSLSLLQAALKEEEIGKRCKNEVSKRISDIEYILAKKQPSELMPELIF